MRAGLLLEDVVDSANGKTAGGATGGATNGAAA